MFFSNVSIAEKYNYLDDKFKAAYKWLRETDIKALPEGSYPILGDKVIANVQEYSTDAKENHFFENHKKFFDIQYMVTGEEMFGVCKSDGLKLKESHEDSDLYFYEEPEFSGEVYLQEGNMIVVAPEDAHKPRCAAGHPMAVKKVVVKVAVD